MKVKSFLVTILALVIATTIFLWNDRRSDLKNELKIVHTVDSKFGGLWVYEDNGMRCLTFKKPSEQERKRIVQSCMYLEKPNHLILGYTHIFLSSLFFNDSPRKILLLGLGGASIPKALNVLAPRAELDIVEINPALVPIVNKYFSFDENLKTHIIIADGAEFVKNASADSYDLILLDAFDSKYIPPALLTDEFMQDIKRIMTKNAIIVSNTFQDSKTYDVESKLHKDNFGSYYHLNYNNSRIMVASKGDLINVAQIEQNARLWPYRFAEVGSNAFEIFKLYKKPDALK